MSRLLALVLAALLLLGAAPASALDPSAAGSSRPDPAWTLAGLRLASPRLLLARRPVTPEPLPDPAELLPADEFGPRGHPTRLRTGAELVQEESRHRIPRILLAAPAGLLATAATFYVGALFTVLLAVPIGFQAPGLGSGIAVGGLLTSAALAVLAGPVAVWGIGTAFGGRGSFLWTALGGLAGWLAAGLTYGLLSSVLGPDQDSLAAWLALGVLASGSIAGYELSSHHAALEAAAELAPRSARRPALFPSLTVLADRGAAAGLALAF